VSAQGVAPLADSVATIRDFPPPPHTIQQLKAFLGLFNFYRYFMPAAASIIRLLTDTLRGNLAGSKAVQWSAEMLAAFDAVKTALQATALLEHPAANADLYPLRGASSSHLGAVLQQRRPSGRWVSTRGSCQLQRRITVPSTVSF
jgi:hypothetical protein